MSIGIFHIFSGCCPHPEFYSLISIFAGSIFLIFREKQTAVTKAVTVIPKKVENNHIGFTIILQLLIPAKDKQFTTKASIQYTEAIIPIIAPITHRAELLPLLYCVCIGVITIFSADTPVFRFTISSICALPASSTSAIFTTTSTLSFVILTTASV